jgi:hypothetical protein
MVVDKSRGFEIFSGQKIDSAAAVNDSECCDKLRAREEIRFLLDADWRNFNLFGTLDDDGDSLNRSLGNNY